MPRLVSIAAAAAALPSALAATVDLPIHFFNTYANVEVEIGTPAQTYNLHFDTGSSTAWVNDKNCGDACPNTGGFDRVYYDINASSTGHSRGARASMEYFGGVTAGPTYDDKFALPDQGFTWTQSFLSADQSSWNNLGSDGFLGLAFNSISDGNTTTVVETLMQQGRLDKPRFGIYYGTEFNSTGSNPDGVLTIGGSREDKYVDGEITYVPLRYETPYQVWRTVLSSITGSVEKKGEKKQSASNSMAMYGNAVFDTGAGSISVPNSMIDAIYESIGWNYQDILNGKHMPLCSEFNSTWSLTFNFGEGSLDPSLTMTGDQFARPGFAYRDDACYPPFEGSDNEGMALIGTPLMQQFYTIFDFGGQSADDFHPRIGFGQLKKEVKP